MGAERTDPVEAPGEAPAEGLTPAERAEVAAHVRHELGEVRLANARALAWFRVALRTVTLGLYAVAWLRLRESVLPVAIAVNVAHLAVGVAVLVLLLRRRLVPAAIGAGALSDFLAVYVGAWRAAGGPWAEAATSYFMGALELLLLFAALTLPRRAVAALGALSFAFMAGVVWRAGLGGSGPALVLVTLAAFAVAVSWAGTRLVEFAARSAAEAHTGRVLRRHRDALRRSEAALREARAQAETLTQLVVHDLRNPLASVSMSLELARKALGGEVPRREGEEALAIARDEADRLTGMIGDLLLVSRLEEGLRAERAPVDVGALLALVARSTEGRVRDAGAALSVSAPPGLRARLDEGLARRLLENLVANAVRFVGPGDRVELAAEGGERLRLAVRNSGLPVPPEVRARLFEKHATHGRRAWHNAGLGLYLCRLAAEAHGGSIALADRAGWNVSFEVEIPPA